MAGKSKAAEKKSRCTVAALSIFISFFILFILLLLFHFTKQSIDPTTLSSYSNLYYSQTPTLSPPAEHPNDSSPEPTSTIVADDDPESLKSTREDLDASSPKPTSEVIAGDPKSPKPTGSTPSPESTFTVIPEIQKAQKQLGHPPLNASSPEPASRIVAGGDPDASSQEPTFGLTGKGPERVGTSGSPPDSSSQLIVDDGVRKQSIFRKDHKFESGVFENVEKSCDIYAGTWVRDERAEEDYPIYRPGSCPYVDEAFDCQVNGRKDSDYLTWRWKPDGCELPRFNATDFLERLRGKRLTVVGDSINRNQFESLLCILREGITNKSRMYEVDGYKITKDRGFFTFKLEDYDCTIEFVRSHFLVREGRVKGKGNSNRTLAIDQIDKSAEKWKQADIIVFNTGHWWTPVKTARGENYYKERDYLYPKLDLAEAYRKALKTWANWIEKNMDPVKKLVFYRGLSSTHFRGGDWDSGGKCDGETGPILHGNFLNRYPLIMKIAEEVVQEMKVPVVLLNVTRLTNFRRDGHPSYYGKRNGSSTSKRPRDCSHWCLPGVPDAWNELIYATLVFRQTSSSHF